MRRTVVRSGALAVALITVGIAWYASVQGSGLPPGGISRDQAVAIVLAQMNTTADHVESAAVGKLSQFAPGVTTSYTAPDGVQLSSSPDQLVWAVTIGGTWYPPCPYPVNCAPAHHETTLLDYYSGAILLGIDGK